jgi:hypothetical protein
MTRRLPQLLACRLVTHVQPDDVARGLLARASAHVQSAEARGQVVQVSFRPGVAPPQ